MFIDRRVLSQFDFVLLLTGLLIPILGLIVLYSAGFDPDAKSFAPSWLPLQIQSEAFFKQALFLVFGTIVLLFALAIPSQTLHRYAYPIYGICIVLLISVLVFGSVSHGAKRWLSLGGITFQPSEAMKLGLILGLARYLSKHPPKYGGYGFLALIIPFCFFLIPMALIFRQPDLGTALSVGAIGFSMVLFMGIRIKSLIIMTISLLIAIYPAWNFLKPYQQRRVLALINPDQDPLGSGYHIIQSKIAVGSGEIFGKGFLGGTQTQLEFLPEHTTDFVFSVLSEEWGFVGATFIIALYLLFLYRMLRVAQKSRDLFASLVCFGVAATIFFHAFVNIGMVVGLLPVVGLPLPLFSYGGSSVLSTMFSLGIVLGIGMRRLTFRA